MDDKKLKLGDFPIEEDYPFRDDVLDDVDEYFLCYPKKGSSKSSRVLKCDKDKFSDTTTYVIRDRKEFIKTYKNSLKMILGLSSTAQRVLWYIMDSMGQKPQYVDITPKMCMDTCGFKTLKSVRDGVVELLSKGVIKRSSYPTKYWVNPLVIFNGDRIEFVKQYIYKED